MTVRLSLSLLALAALLIPPATAKDKTKPVLPEDVLRAQTVRVIIDPDAGEPIDQPNANATARDNVEKALMDWARFRLVLDRQESDLIIVIRTGNGKLSRPTIKGGPIDQRPGVAQSSDGRIHIGAQTGQPPPMGDPSADPQSPGQSPSQRPHLSNEIGASDDSFAVYRGNASDPLDAPPVWRYVAKDGLRAPKVAAVEEFRKAVAASQRPAVPKTP
ncbi:MAG TPA: hypothetical protein VE377_20265 [Candidatus Dormibacteraeota bacterium]|nr:hypothetical protein [Candidatus Dormibacteraeota bacterium]